MNSQSFKGALATLADDLILAKDKIDKAWFAIGVIVSDYCTLLDEQTNLRTLSFEFNRFRNLAEIALDYSFEAGKGIQDIQECVDQRLKSERRAAVDESIRSNSQTFANLNSTKEAARNCNSKAAKR